MKITNTKLASVMVYLLTVLSVISVVSAQSPVAQTARATESSSDTYLFIIGLLVVIVFGMAFYFWRSSKRSSESSQYDYANRVRSNSKSADDETVDAAMELAWFRGENKKPKRQEKKKERRQPSLQAAAAQADSTEESWVDPGLESRRFQEKMKKLQFAQLPIHSFLQLTEARPFENLMISSDPSLLNAIEQANDEFEEDETVRELAVRVLAMFRTRNAVEALSQIALYDLSANVRSKAVAVLTDFDHESVFEVILLACADPTREVRAAAARGLFRLSLNRAEAWKRLIATGDEYRMRQAVRAAIESGIVESSFERLIHEDMSIAYEAFALTGLLIKSGESAPIFQAIINHKDERIRLALIHVLDVVKDDRSGELVAALATDRSLSEEVTKKINVLLGSLQSVSV